MKQPNPSHLFLSLVFFLFITLSSSAVTAKTAIDEREKTYKELEIFANSLSVIQENYVEEIDIHEVMEGALSGMLYSLDPHSSYLTKENFQELKDETSGSFSGIGIEVSTRDGHVIIVSPIDGTPAAKAGLKAHDVIVKIDGISTKSMAPFEAIKKLRGSKGSEVTISVFRQGWKEAKDFTIKRDIIPLNSIRSLSLEPGIFYIRTTNFQEHTTRDFNKAIRTLNKKHPIKGLILDLRGNPGGLLDQAVSIADIFIHSGLIVSTKGRDPKQDITFKAQKQKNRTNSNYPIVVLVNEGSASASEIVAGAIQDHKRGIIVGTRTFGKGSVQTILPMPGGAGLRITTARYYTPNGRSIQATGITPDVVVEMAPPAAQKNAHPATREADLKNHFANPKDAAEKKSEKTSEEDRKQNSEKEKIQQRMVQDSQLREAVNILKSIIIFQAGSPTK